MAARTSSPPVLHTEEDDLSHPHFVRFDNDHPYSDRSSSSKGKDRETRSISPADEHMDAVAYPPISEDAEETRRVEENLRRWELAERQRRKAARASTASASLVTDVSRRASLLWAGRKTRNASLGGIGTHTVLQSTDNTDIVPLTHINNSPTPSPTHSDFDVAHPVDPFANPPEMNPFTDSHQSTSSLNNTLDPSSTTKSSSPAGASLTPPPPRPLNLPPPRTPPPIIESHDTPSSDPTSNKRDDDTKEVRWWHDWLCGCNEGPDRGGDNQAGRTNPFE